MFSLDVSMVQGVAMASFGKVWPGQRPVPARRVRRPATSESKTPLETEKLPKWGDFYLLVPF